jgi:hypothetical protein
MVRRRFDRRRGLNGEQSDAMVGVVTDICRRHGVLKFTADHGAVPPIIIEPRGLNVT